LRFSAAPAIPELGETATEIKIYRGSRIKRKSKIFGNIGPNSKKNQINFKKFCRI
jgi:hypothetical protein